MADELHLGAKGIPPRWPVDCALACLLVVARPFPLPALGPMPRPLERRSRRTRHSVSCTRRRRPFLDAAWGGEASVETAAGRGWRSPATAETCESETADSQRWDSETCN